MAALNAIVCEALLAEASQHLPTSARSASATPHVVEAAAVRELQAAHAALGTVREEAATVGRQLLPLRSAAELATLLQAELLYPPGTPKRSNKVLVELRTHGVAMPSEFELDLLLSRLHAHDEWNRALRSMTVPSEQRCVLVPPVTECVVCGSTQFVHARDGRSSPRTVYSCRGKLSGELCGMQCNRDDCGAVHYMSFASGGKKLPPGTQVFYEGAAELPWFQPSLITVYETALLHQLNVQMLHSHTGWETFCREYSMLHKLLAAEVDLMRRVLARSWLSWSLSCSPRCKLVCPKLGQT